LDSLKVHRNRHEHARALCEHCGKDFVRHSVLKTHQTTGPCGSGGSLAKVRKARGEGGRLPLREKGTSSNTGTSDNAPRPYYSYQTRLVGLLAFDEKVGVGEGEKFCRFPGCTVTVRESLLLTSLPRLIICCSQTGYSNTTKLKFH
jgi:hypothetical protein